MNIGQWYIVGHIAVLNEQCKGEIVSSFQSLNIVLSKLYIRSMTQKRLSLDLATGQRTF